MDFLKNNRRFDFLYGGKPFAELAFETQQTEAGDTLTTVYTLPDGLKITNIATRHGDAWEWVNWFENTSDTPSEIISDLWDAAVAFPMPYEEAVPWSNMRPAFDEITTLYAPTGSGNKIDEFYVDTDAYSRGDYLVRIALDTVMTFANKSGLSSGNQAPFFHVHKDNKGYVFAIGWTGQWNCSFERTPEAIIVKSKLENTHFRLLPGEKIRTSSFVAMPYEGTVYDGQNKWRRLVKKDFSLIGKEGRPQIGPLCTGVIGGMPSNRVLERIQTVRENQLPFEYFWMDCGWFGGESDLPADAHWYSALGDWTVNRKKHPKGLKDVSAAVHEAGMKFLLWFEPEKSFRGVPIVEEHPEYFILRDGADPFLDLSSEDAWRWYYTLLSDTIREIGIDCYRQDCNIDPLLFWRSKDADDRRGMTEIKHIMGLYRLWDTLLEEFPHLIIDNCASGGHRIDIETLRRSVPLWRSDLQCTDNFVPEGTQCHSLNYNAWVPYSGTGTGSVYDLYRFRSAYAPALLSNYGFYEYNDYGADKMPWLKSMLAEYLKVRPYLSEDFYPLTKSSDRNDIWCAAQYHRPEQDDGVLQAFRRERSPYPMAEFALFGLDTEADYVFTDADTGAETLVNGQTLMTQGFCVTIPEKRASKLYFYKKK